VTSVKFRYLYLYHWILLFNWCAISFNDVHYVDYVLEVVNCHRVSSIEYRSTPSFDPPAPCTSFMITAPKDLHRDSATVRMDSPVLRPPRKWRLFSVGTKKIAWNTPMSRADFYHMATAHRHIARHSVCSVVLVVHARIDFTGVILGHAASPSSM